MMSMNRRSFIKSAAASAACACAPWVRAATPSLAIKEFTIKIGLPKPFEMLHITDSHVCRADQRESAMKREFAEMRQNAFKSPDAALDEQLNYMAGHKIPLIHTGDFTDFLSAANTEKVASTFRGLDCIASIGNHERSPEMYTKSSGSKRESAEYCKSHLPLLKAAWPNDWLFASKVYHGVNFCAFDNVHNNISSATVEKRLREEVARGLPIVLACHVPFYSEEQFADELKHPIPYNPPWIDICGTPDEVLAAHKKKATRTTDMTVRFMDYFRNQKLVKAVICGHIHRYSQSTLEGTARITQYCGSRGFRGEIEKFTFV